MKTITPWRSPLARALERNKSKPYSRYFQLATVQADGRPANRTVVFRGFQGCTDQLKTITDTRSQKVDQILHQPWGEACWYFTETREQFRLAGELTLIEANHPDPELQKARNLTWQDLSDNARLQFAWPHPGETRAERGAGGAGGAGGAEEGRKGLVGQYCDPASPLPNFCLLLLDPVKVDHLELRGDPQNRWLYLREEDRVWSTMAINP